MAQAIINRPQYQIDFEDNFTSLPNSLFNLGRYFDDIKPLHTAVYNYLLTKKQTGWTIHPSDIAKAQNIGESTARRALTKLRKLGLMSFTRFKDGGGQWKVEVPDFLLEKPLSQKPLVAKPLNQNDAVLEKNHLLEKNKETTTNSVVVDLPTEINTLVVKSHFSRLNPAQQLLALKTWCGFAGKKNAIGSAIDFAKKAKAGELTDAVEKVVVNPVEKERQRRKDLIAFMQKHREKLSIDFQTKDFVRSETFGNITRVMFRDFETRKL